MKNWIRENWEKLNDWMEKQQQIVIFGFLLSIVCVTLLIGIIISLSCCTYQPPVIEPEPIPEVALVLPLQIQYQGKTLNLPLMWLDFSDVDADGDLDIIGSCWHDVQPDVAGNQKAIAVWSNNGPGKIPGSLWSTVWTEPQSYFSYPDCTFEQGALTTGNIIGGDNARCEIAYRRFDNTNETFNLVICNGLDGSILKKTVLDFDAEWSHGCQDLLAGNFTQPRGAVLSDLICVYRYFGKTARYIESRRASDLGINWTHSIEAGGRFNEAWTCHRPGIIHWPNGKDCLWRGLGILDWNGGGTLGQAGIQNYPIELHNVAGEDNLTRYHFDSFCYFPGTESPILYVTEDGNQSWRFPKLTTFTKPDGRKYLEYNADLVMDDPTTTHTHRLRALKDGNTSTERRILMTDVKHGDNSQYRALILDGNFKILNALNTWEESEKIEFNGDHSSYEVITDYAIYDINGVKIANHLGQQPNIIEQIFIGDMFGSGHQQYTFARKTSNGVFEIVFISNPKAKKNNPVNQDPNHHFYAEGEPVPVK